MYEFLSHKVCDFMTAHPVVIRSDASLADARTIFDMHEFNALPVIDGDRFVGLFSKLDLLKAFVFTAESVVPPYDEIMRAPVARYMTTQPLTVEPDCPLTRVLQKMIDTRCKSFPVVEQGRLVGIIAREDVLRALAPS